MGHGVAKILDPAYVAPLVIRPICYGIDDELQQIGHLRCPEGNGPWPVVVMIHGGFWKPDYDLKHADHLCLALTESGIATWNIEYRRIGSDGGWPKTFEDVIDAVNYLGRILEYYPLDLNRVVVAGHSVGGQLALWLGGDHSQFAHLLNTRLTMPLKGIVSLAGVTDLRLAWKKKLCNKIIEQFLGGDPFQVSDLYKWACPTRGLPLHIPRVLIHGKYDTDVPVCFSQHYKKMAQKAGDPMVEVVELECGHLELVHPMMDEYKRVRQKIADFL